jgi:hypothetical protein
MPSAQAKVDADHHIGAMRSIGGSVRLARAIRIVTKCC